MAWKVPENCPVKRLTEALRGKLKRDFSCDVCLINPRYCRAYLAGNPSVVTHFRIFLALAEGLRSG